MKLVSLASRWQPTTVVAVLAIVGMAGCAMHRNASTAADPTTADRTNTTAFHPTTGSTTLPRMAPTQSTEATGQNPTVNQ